MSVTREPVSDRVGAEEAARHFARDLENRVVERTRELEAERTLLDAVIDTVPVGLVVANREGKIIRANAEALRALRVSSLDAAQFTRWDETEAYDPEGHRVPSDQFPIARSLRAGEVVVGERLELAAGGGRVVVEVGSAPVVDAEGTIIGGVAVLQDVTTRERVDRVEREFVANAAHQLQSPLAAIISATEVLQSGAKDRPERDAFLGHIEREAGRLARLVRALLTLARAQTGSEAPKDELVPVEPLLGDIAGSLHVADGVAVEVDCGPDLAVLSNRELIEQAVVNLAENAAKHTSAGRIVLGCRSVDGSIELSVADTGDGIPAAERPHVFQRFFRGKADTEGFGLGLAIVGAVADALEAELELDSTVGVGTVVRLRLPHAATMVSP
jgi:PAS domain S-box-containing protein